MKQLKFLLPLSLLSAVVLAVSAGHAARFRVCNGSPVKWRGEHRLLKATDASPMIQDAVLRKFEDR